MTMKIKTLLHFTVLIFVLSACGLRLPSEKPGQISFQIKNSIPESHFGTASNTLLSQGGTSAAPFQLSQDYCYAVLVSGDSPEYDLGPTRAAGNVACANRPTRLGKIFGLAGKGDVMTLDLTATGQYRFDLIGLAKTPSVGTFASVPLNCAGVVEASLVSETAVGGVAANKIQISLDSVQQNFDVRLMASNSVSVVAGDNLIDLYALGGPEGVSLECSSSPSSTGVSSGVSVNQVSAIMAPSTYGFGSVIPIQVQFTAPVDVVGIPEFALNTLPARKAVYASGSGTNILIFNYVVQNGDSTPVGLALNLSDIAISPAGAILEAGTLNTVQLALPNSTSSQSMISGSQVYIDAVAPLLLVTTPSSVTPINITSSVVSGVCESGLMVNIDSLTGITATGTLCTGGAFAIPVTLTGGNGLKTIGLKQVDNAGNNSPIQMAYFDFDNTAPVGVSLSTGSAYVNAGTANNFPITIGCQVGDANPILQRSPSGAGTFVNFQSLSPCTSSTMNFNVDLSSLSDGTWDLRIYQQDTATNFMISSIVTVNKDTSPPTLTITTPTGGFTVTETTSSSYSVTGLCTGVENGGTVSLVVGPTNSQSYSGTCSSGSFSIGNVNFFNRPDGASSIVVTADASDLAGNAASQVSVTLNKSVQLFVEPIYAGFGNWGQYVDRNPSIAFYDLSSPTACATPGSKLGYIHCLHGGELRRVRVKGLPCADLQISDSQNAFDWKCIPIGFDSLFVSRGLKENKGLRDLINFSTPAWLNMSVTVGVNSNAWTLSSGVSQWWTNSVAALPSTPAPLTTNIVYVLGANFGTIPSTGVWTLASGTSVVSANGVKIQHSGSVGALLSTSASTSAVWIEADIECTAATNTRTGISMQATTSFGTVKNTRITNCQTNGIAGSSTKNSRFLNVDINGAIGTTAPAGIGLLLNNTSAYNLLENVKVSNSKNSGVTIDTGQYNVLSRILVTSGDGDGIEIIGTAATAYSQNNIFASTAAGFVFDGLFLSNSNAGGSISNSTVHNFLAVNNGKAMNGERFANSVISDLAIGHGGQGVVLTNSSTNKFTGILNIDSDIPTTNDCAVTGGTNPGLTAGDTSGGNTGCQTNGASDHTRLTVSGVVGGVSTFERDIKGYVPESFFSNQSHVSFSSIDSVKMNWLTFSSPFRTFVKSTTTQPTFMTAYRGQCIAGDGNCDIVDWGIKTSAAYLLNKSYDQTNDNGAWVGGSNCPSAAHGNNVRTDASSTSYLATAVEFLGDNVGNDDGRCQTGDRCLYLPNIGAYQGEGNLESCNFQPGTISNVFLYGHSTNGR
jgi:hypothetical protein